MKPNYKHDHFAQSLINNFGLPSTIPLQNLKLLDNNSIIF